MIVSQRIYFFITKAQNYTKKLQLDFKTNVEYTFLGPKSSAWDFGQKLSNALATAQPHIGLFLLKQLIFAKSWKNQLN